MSEGDLFGQEDISVSLNTMPRSALQALYYAVTGKTEKLSRTLKGNVIITYNDFEQLFLKVTQQMEHYELLVNPTTTVVVKQIDKESLQYSSWERFREFQTSSSAITSEVSLKIEFITKIPKTPAPQRFIVSIGLDSGLSVVSDKSDRVDGPYAGFFMFLARDFPAIDISIDFVDFLIAKIFSGLIEEWFTQLPRIKNPKISLYLLSRIEILTSIIFQLGRVGFSVFIASYVYFEGGLHLGPNLVYAISVGILLWSVLAVVVTFVNKLTLKAIFRSICPSVIIFTQGDRRAYDDVKQKSRSLKGTILKLILTTVGTFVINILSSLLFIKIFNLK